MKTISACAFAASTSAVVIHSELLLLRKPMIGFDYPTLFYPFAIVAVLLAGISKGGFGAVAGGLAVPILSIVIPPHEAAGIMLPILCAMDIFGVHAYWGRWSIDHLRILLPSGLIGIALGAFAFGTLSVEAVRLIIGGIAIVYSANKFLDITGKIAGFLSLRPRTPGKFLGVFCGILSGFTSTLAHSGGPPFAVYIYSQKLDKTLIVATSAGFFCFANYIKLIPYYFLGQLNTANLGTALLFAPLAPLGVWLGVWLHKRISHAVFFNVSYLLLGVSGIKLIYDAFAL